MPGVSGYTARACEISPGRQHKPGHPGHPARQEHPVGRPAAAGRTSVEDVGVDHRDARVAVAEPFLDGSEVVAVLEQVTFGYLGP